MPRQAKPHDFEERSEAIITFVTANLLNYDGKDPEQADRYAELASLLRRQEPDILAVQELISSGPDNDVASSAARRTSAEVALCELANYLGMQCIADGTPAVAISRTRHHTGLLWRDGIDVVPRTLMRYDSDVYPISHGLTVAVFDLGGPKLRAGSAHLSHFDPGLSGGWKDAGQIMRAFNRNDDIPGVVGGDWQGIGADETYDPDPYEGKAWDPSHAYHYDLDGRVDRHAAIRLERHGKFRDCARLLDATWTATTGHHETDTNQPRRIDRIYVTHDFPADAVTSFRVVDPAAVGQSTDHCPVVLDIDESCLRTRTMADAAQPG